MKTEKHLWDNGKDYALYLFDDKDNLVWAWENEQPSVWYLTEWLKMDCIEDVYAYFFDEIEYYLDGYPEEELTQMKENKDDCNYLTVMSKNDSLWQEIARESAKVWWKTYMTA